MPIISGSQGGSNFGQSILSKTISDILGKKIGGKSTPVGNPAADPNSQGDPSSNSYPSGFHPPMALPGQSPTIQTPPAATKPMQQPPMAPDQNRSLSTEPPTGAIDRAIQKQQQDPMMLIHQGRDAANDPNLPIPYEDRMHILDKLSRARHGIGDGEWQPSQQQQGQITQGKQQSGNASGIIGTVAALL